MRTTLDIDDDVLLAAKERAAVEKRSAGKVLSELARAALRSESSVAAGELNGFPILRGREGIVTSELVEKLLDEE